MSARTRQKLALKKPAYQAWQATNPRYFQDVRLHNQTWSTMLAITR